MSKKRHTSANNALTLPQARRQTQRYPTDPDAWLALGRLLAEQKDWENARDALEQAHSLRSENADQQAWLGHIAYHQNRTQDAMHHLHDALARNPALVLGLVTLAKFHIDRSEFQQGLEYAQQAYEASPQHIPCIDTLASALSGLFRYEEALELYRRLTEMVPQDFSSWNNAGNMLRDLGRLNESYAYYKQANTVGHHPTPYSNYLTALHYDPRVSREEIMAFAKSWEKRFAPASHLVLPRPERPNAASTQILRLGLLSDGFRKHPVGKMITRCLENLPKGQFELYCYTTSDAIDVITKRIQHCAQHWQPIRHLDDDGFIKQIRDDEIDILIDLSGHNTGSRMRAVAMQPAPLIVKWVGGLINTTGVQAIDYLISDHVETPEGEDEYYTEKLIRMPDDYIVFNPPEKLPALSELPAKQNGYITLACFNNPTKLNDVALKQWASIMHELPNSRLMLKGRPYTSESFCERLYATLEAEGIARERLIIEGPGSNYEMLDAYNRADISLDPWPYSGGLTTCESFIMGVPVVTLPGPTFAGRHSATHLVHAGMPELVVNSWEEYRARVIELASDLDSLGIIRQHLRNVLLQSPVCDGPRFAKHFTDAMRAIWQRYCDDKPPAALTFNKDGEARFEDEGPPVEIHYAEAPEDDSEFQWQFEGKIIAVDNGGQLLESAVIRQLLQREALELIALDPSSQALDTSLKQHTGVHYYPNTTLGDGQPGQLHACLDPKLSATLAPLGNEHQPEAIRQGSQVLTRLPLSTVALDSIQGLPAIDWLVLDDLNDATAILDNGTQALKDTLLLQVKVAFQPTHKGQPNLAEIQHWASRNGFRFYRLHEPQHRSHLPEDIPEAQRQATELVSAYALLLPNTERMAALSDGQRMKLAFVLSTGLGAHDIAYKLIFAMDQSGALEFLESKGLITASTQSQIGDIVPTPAGPAIPQSEHVSGEPVVSVICATYNHRDYIEDAIDGFISQQTNFPFEVIIHDDASTDGTQEIIKKYAEEYPQLIRPIYQEENQYSQDRKPLDYCLPLTNGRYIAICEGDDYWTDSRKLQLQCDYMEQHPNCVLTHHNAFILKNRSIVKNSKLPNTYQRGFIKKELLENECFILTLSMMFRKVFNKFPKEKGGIGNGDNFLISMLGLYGESAYLTDIAPAAYRLHESSTWSSKNKTEKSRMLGNSLYWIGKYHERKNRIDIAKYYFKKSQLVLNDCIQPQTKNLQPKAKIFCIGRGKTGTTSVKKAFKDLGFKVGNQRTAELLADKHYFSGSYKEIVEYCKTATVFQDAPFSYPETYKHLDKAYPGSKFILTVRDNAEQWYQSITRFHAKKFGKNGNLPTADDLKSAEYVRRGFMYNTVKIHGTPDEDPYNKETMLAHYEKHNRDVIEYFKDRPNDLLIINLSEKGAYQKFCRFIGIEPTSESFSWENKT